MHLSILLLATLATALPTNYTSPLNPGNNTANPTNFYLVTTTSSTRSGNSSLLPNVSATSLFDPLAQTNYLLRLIGPGYNSLPLFNLTDGTLETEAAGPHGIGEFEYNSTRVRAGEDLMFAPAAQPKGNLGLEDGFLLTVGGETEGWRVCAGDLGQEVISLLLPSFSSLDSSWCAFFFPSLSSTLTFLCVLF
jgi:hypothetical protein